MNNNNKIIFTGERYVPEHFNDEKDEIIIEHENRYKSIKNLVENKIVLDAACGVGYGSYEISRYAQNVIGIDISDEAIAYAQKTYKMENLIFQTASVVNLPFNDNTFDVIVSFETIEHITEKQQSEFLNEIERVLKEDGLLIISTPDKLNYSDKRNYKNEFHIKEFYEDEFFIFLKQKFNSIKFFYQSEEICNLIYSSDSKNMELIRKDFDLIGKYIIAICSNNDLNNFPKIDCLSIENNKLDFFIDRINKLQIEVIEKTSWAINLDKELKNSNDYIQKLQTEVKEKTSWGISLDKELKDSREYSENLKEEIESKTAWAISLDKELKNSNDYIQKLQTELKEKASWGISLENELMSVYTSKSWKVTRLFRNLKRGNLNNVKK